MNPTAETYPEFLERVHRDDVAQGKARHKDGVCKVCTPDAGKDTQ